MRSIGGTTTIVATIITLIFVPVVKKGKVTGHRVEFGPIRTIECQRGQRIPATEEAVRLGVAGKVCRSVITRVVRADGGSTIARLKRERASRR